MKTEPLAAIDGEQLLARAADIEIASRSLKAMSHPLRLKILCTLGNREVCVQGIVDNVGTSQSNISQHLAILRDKGILSSRKDANKVFYRVGDEPFYGIKVYCRRARMRTRFFTVSVMNARCDSLE
jgi:ArsR family transcriptional regulator